MSWFPEFWQQSEHLVRELTSLPHPGIGGNRHGESIMIDQPFA
jgi:hypothetical protein